jgi:serpin B
LTRLVLANAIYFKGDWASQFKKEATRDASFKLANGETVEVPMMFKKDDFRLARSKEFQALELPYEGDDLSMIVLLPNEPDNLPTLTYETLLSLEFDEMEIAVQLPKFKIESSFSLAETLSALGMPLAFSDGADFSGITGNQELFIGAAAHKAFIEVDEEGTEAAAVTGITFGVTSMPQQFIANRPFLFVIRENSTGTMLFIGRVTDPR